MKVPLPSFKVDPQFLNQNGMLPAQVTVVGLLDLVMQIIQSDREEVGN